MSRKTFKKVITSDEHWENVNPKNKELMKEFLEEKNIRSSDTTIKGYESDLKIFFVWNYLHNNNLFFVEIKKLQFSKFFGYVTTELKCGSSRFSRLRSVLSTLSNFIEKYLDEDYPNFRNVILKSIENMPKVARREKTILKDEQIERLFVCLEEKKEYQIACWLSLAIASGSRFSELLRFTTDIIDENNVAFDGIFLETLKPVKSKGRSKTGKLSVKYIIKDIFWKHYQTWLKIRGEILDKNKKDHTSIFINSIGDPIQEGAVRGWVKLIEEFLGIPFYPHAVRHFTTTMLSKLGLPYALIKELFAWESIEMVEIYNDQTAKDKIWKELDNLKVSLSKNEI